MERNPYAPPVAEVRDPITAPANEDLAPRWRRFLNMLLDFGGYLCFAMLIGVVIGVAAPSLLGKLHNMGTLGDYLFGFTLMSTYYVIFEGFFDRTPGKFITRTRVVTESGHSPTMRQVFIRTIVRFIPFEAFSFLFGLSAIGWHDRLSGTRVVRNSR